MQKFFSLSKPAQAGVGAGGAATLLATGVGLGSGKWEFLLVLVVLLVVVLGGFLLWTAWQRQKLSARLGGELQQHGSASPRTISDPGKRARLDDLRKKFDQGVQEYRSRGKDLYTLPWYVLVGEPGSGKTEAVRHSNVGFPPGMQDEFQGVGGTINMNWWFTNHAVILDTAGRLMFEEVKPGESSEWREFLGLLKKHRPTCPINGLLLVIPSDSLIKDTAEEIARKAGQIARQLDVIQRVLDVRFPVFVAVTKCDKINGFREFFDSLTDPQLQHQMLGWANPDPLDAPFRAELVDQHLEKVAGRLRRRRLGLLRDPVAEKVDGRRTDEVDALYALPHSLGLLAPRLRRYLETIFVAGEWSAKPLFLRGIFFTSSMREGSALDEELAHAIGVPVEDLPEGKVWERERAYFLRDLFIEKIFREKGLVTRATNTGQMLRRRQLALFGVGAAALLVFLGVTWLGTRSMKTNVTDRSTIWHGVAQADWWPDGIWKQSIVPRFRDGSYPPYAAHQIVVQGVKRTPGDFHAYLRAQAETPLPKNWLLPGLDVRFNRDSRAAQRIVFETGVIRPLLEAARQRLNQSLPADSGTQHRLAEALATLIRLEADLARPDKAPAGTPPAPDAADQFLSSLLAFATTNVTKADTNLVATLVRTYSGGKDPGAVWPAAWCSEAAGGTNRSLAGFRALRAGLAQLVRGTTNNLQEHLDAWRLTVPVRHAVQTFEDAERGLLAAAQGTNAQKFFQHLAALTQAKTNLDQHLARLRSLSLFQSAGTLTNAYQQILASAQTDSVKALATVKAENDRALQTNQNAQPFVEIRQELAALQQTLQTRLQNLETPSDLTRMAALDRLYLAGNSYAERWALYQSVTNATGARPFAGELIGLRGEPLDRFLKEVLEPLRARPAAYAGDFKNELNTVLSYGLTLGEQMQRKALLEAYLREANRLIKGSVGFPLVLAPDKPMTLDTLKEVIAHVTSVVSLDLPSPAFQAPPFKDSEEWGRFAKWITSLAQVGRTVLDKNRDPLNCSVTLLKHDDNRDGRLDDKHWRWQLRYVRLGDSGRKTRSVDGGELGTVHSDQKFFVQLTPRDDSDEGMVDLRAGDWGAFAWLARYGGRKSDAGGATWQVQLPFKELTGKEFTGSVPIQVRFDEPLTVSPDNWPRPTW